jgi:hypothetical protein
MTTNRQEQGKAISQIKNDQTNQQIYLCRQITIKW